MTTTTEHAHLCPGCFTDKGTASLCPHCGYDESLKRGPLVLPHRTLLHHGQYLIGKVLGKPGGFGITYLALDTRLETRVAIKEYLPRDLAGRDAGHATISAHSAEDGEFFRYGLTQFLQEARTLAQFDHANIVRVRNFFEENGTGYLVMDYYDGITLADYLAQQPQGKLPEQTAVGILMPILDGLREVHARNILHRDIKPQNIYLTTANRPILLDFGAARQAMGERSRSLSVVLSEGYAPYEQYHRRGEQGPWTDIYACAAVLYHAVSGQAPPPATERMHKDELDIAALGVSATLAEALRLGLAADHHKRPQKMMEFHGLLLGNDAPVLSGIGQKPLEPAIVPTQGKNPFGMKTWALAALGVAVIAALALGTRHEPQSVPAAAPPAPVEEKKPDTAAPPVTVVPVAETKSPLTPITEEKPEITLPAIPVAAFAPAPPPAPAPMKELTPGKTFRDCPKCPEMVVIPAGSFEMGSNNGFEDERPMHRATISRAFAIGKTEVTQEQWRAIMGNNPSEFKNCGDNCPVEGVSWNDIQAFIQKLNAETGKQYRLPSEAEWEYACRAGSRQEYCGSDNLDSIAWYGNNSVGVTHPVAQKQANAFGLYDMSGNVWEWAEDSWHGNYNGAPTDGSAWSASGDGAKRALRGGSWVDIPQNTRAAYRSRLEPAFRLYYIGFRLVRTLP